MTDSQGQGEGPMALSRRAVAQLAATQRTLQPVPRQNGAASVPSAVSHGEPPEPVLEFGLERYRYILAQINTVNENVYRFLAIYQAIASATVTAGLALFVGYRGWKIDVSVARTGVIGLACLETVVALFTMLLIFIGVLAWLDYRREECELTDKLVRMGFRQQPRIGNFFRWYETYIILFIAISTIFVWIFVLVLILPNMR
jgi:hypothetical protein